MNFYKDENTIIKDGQINELIDEISESLASSGGLREFIIKLKNEKNAQNVKFGIKEPSTNTKISLSYKTKTYGISKITKLNKKSIEVEENKYFRANEEVFFIKNNQILEPLKQIISIENNILTFDALPKNVSVGDFVSSFIKKESLEKDSFFDIKIKQLIQANAIIGAVDSVSFFCFWSE